MLTLSRSAAFRVVAGVISLAALVLTTPAFHAQEPERDPDAAKLQGFFGGLPYRYIGPPGNRVAAVAGVSGDENVYYAGGASGGA